MSNKYAYYDYKIIFYAVPEKYYGEKNIINEYNLADFAIDSVWNHKLGSLIWQMAIENNLCMFMQEYSIVIKLTQDIFDGIYNTILLTHKHAVDRNFVNHAVNKEFDLGFLLEYKKFSATHVVLLEIIKS